MIIYIYSSTTLLHNNVNTNDYYYYYTISASVKDTSVKGADGLNLEWTAPFRFKDYVVGFKYKLGESLKNAPETLFAKKSIATGSDGTATIEANYNVADKTLSAIAKWASDKVGIALSAEGNTDDKLTNVAIVNTQTVGGNKLTVGANYDVLDKKASLNTKLAVDDTVVGISYDNVDKDPVLAVSHQLDAKNAFSPSVSLKNGAVKYGWVRKWSGGSADLKLTPGEKLTVEWKDQGANGVWTTKAEIPVNDQAKSKISFAHDWTY
jgi:hypothetical protein